MTYISKKLRFSYIPIYFTNTYKISIIKNKAIGAFVLQ